MNYSEVYLDLCSFVRSIIIRAELPSETEQQSRKEFEMCMCHFYLPIKEQNVQKMQVVSFLHTIYAWKSNSDKKCTYRWKEF